MTMDKVMIKKAKAANDRVTLRFIGVAMAAWEHAHPKKEKNR